MSTISKTVTVKPVPDATITVTSPVCDYVSGLTASVLNAGPGAAYNWSLTNGTITDGQGTPNITWTSGASGSASLFVTVTNSDGCTETPILLCWAIPTPMSEDVTCIS